MDVALDDLGATFVFDEPMMFDDPVFGDSRVVMAEPWLMTAGDVYVDSAAATAPAPLDLAMGAAAQGADARPAGQGATARSWSFLDVAAAAAAELWRWVTDVAAGRWVLLGQSTCCRAGHGDRRSRQSNRYLTYHGALHP